MASCMTELHLWTLRNQTIVSDGDVGCYTYHERGETVSVVDQPYYQQKQQYTEGRGTTWAPKTKRPDKLRDAIKEAEDLLSGQPCVSCLWTSRYSLQILLANGTILNYSVNPNSGDVERITIDKSLVGKLSADVFTDVIVTDAYFIMSYMERGKLDFVYFNKKSQEGGAKKQEKISTLDPKVSQIDLPGPTGRRLKRSLSANVNQNMVLVWWHTASEEAWPWSPMSSDIERANMILLSIVGSKVDIAAFIRTEYDPVDVSFSCLQPHQIFSVEQSSNAVGEHTVDITVYEHVRNKLQRAAVTTVPLKSSVVCQARNHGEDRQLLGLQDNTLVLHDDLRKITQMTQADVEVSVVCWHPEDTIFCVCSKTGDIQLFDMALSPLLTKMVSETPVTKNVLSLAPYFRSPPRVCSVEWCNFPCEAPGIDTTEPLLIHFDRGPLGLLLFQGGAMNGSVLTPLHLLNHYCRHRQMDQAVNLCSSLNWDSDGPSCYTVLSKVMNCLLKMSLNPDREAQLETCLGCFYAPCRPLSEVTVLEYRDQISRLARRFFHHLLRYSRFEKAFLLAVDIGSRDLFMDIYHVAKDRGELALAAAAKRKADQIEAQTVGPYGVEGYGELGPDPYWSGEVSLEPNGLVEQLDSMHAPQARQAPQTHSQYVQQLERGEDMARLNPAQLQAQFAPPIDPNSVTIQEEEEIDETSGTVKVIHFGMV
ncbi:unnamed protein product [Owenia fusiformis]|uniref:Uncharacterized protein n=1 Tax=Owenia fusiformis TaxID=6347 RepID=A0A8S4PGT4_OWEFU|nr:unnamed protein product [Owenia fusiformis]